MVRRMIFLRDGSTWHTDYTGYLPMREEILINHTGLCPNPLTTTSPLNCSSSRPLEPRDQPPDQIWDNGRLSNSPTSVRTPDGESFEAEEIYSEPIRNIYSFSSRLNQQQRQALPEFRSANIGLEHGTISETAHQYTYNPVTENQRENFNAPSYPPLTSSLRNWPLMS